MTVLVVEDDAPVARLLELILRVHGAEVQIARTADEALQVIEEDQPNLLLVDVKLPGPSGLELAKAVREQPELAETPIVLMSAYGEPACTEADAFLAKPFEYERVVEVVGSYLGWKG